MEEVLPQMICAHAVWCCRNFIAHKKFWLPRKMCVLPKSKGHAKKLPANGAGDAACYRDQVLPGSSD